MKSCKTGGSNSFIDQNNYQQLSDLMTRKPYNNNLYVKLHGNNFVDHEYERCIVPNNLIVIHFFVRRMCGFSDEYDEIKLRNN